MDVIGFGALNIDKIFFVDKIPKKDEESFIKSIETHFGGSAANTIVGLSRLGLKTAYIGKVGNDDDGYRIIEDLKREGVNTRNIKIGKGRTGLAMIFVDSNGNRAILLDPGVNDEIKYSEIDVDFVNEFKILHLSSFVCKNSKLSFESQRELVKNTDIEVSFDPGHIYAQKGLDALRDIIKRTSIFLPNKIEIEMMTQRNYIDGAKFLIEKYKCKIVAVKLGRTGCHVFWKKHDIFIPSFKTNIVDTTGAGDAFNAGFLYGYLNNKPPKICGILGNLVASLKIRKPGPRSGLPKKDELSKMWKDFIGKSFINC